MILMIQCERVRVFVLCVMLWYGMGVCVLQLYVFSIHSHNRRIPSSIKMNYLYMDGKWHKQKKKRKTKPNKMTQK